jgi:hypothetical protein
VVIALAAIVATRSADAQCGEPGAGDCFSANGTPGCASLDCCKTVCAIIPFCCEVGWDETCADAAVTFCTCGSPISGDCFTPNSSPGCDDAECCETVCAIDPFCCDGDWDGLCVRAAANRAGTSSAPRKRRTSAASATSTATARWTSTTWSA